MDYSQFIGQAVTIEIANPGKSNGFFGANVLAQQQDGLLVECSKGGSMTQILLPFDRIVSIVLR
jgi:hypothetical protein